MGNGSKLVIDEDKMKIKSSLFVEPDAVGYWDDETETLTIEKGTIRLEDAGISIKVKG